VNESEFQRRCDEVVYREVYCCVSTMAEYILHKSYDGEDPDTPFSYDDIENPMQSAEFKWNDEWVNIYSTEELEEWKADRESAIEEDRESELADIEDDPQDNDEEREEGVNEKYDQQIDDLNEVCNEAESQLEEYKEIYEYWICSPWLISKLSERNEAVIPHEQIWCRCTTGQSISIDGVIREIIKEYVLTDEEKASLKEK